MKKRLLSALLVLVMVLTMLPATVFAAAGDATPATITIPLSLGNATWASGDSISVTSDGNTSLNITISPTFDSSTGTQNGWSASGAPQGYTATYNGTSLVLTAQNAGATSLSNDYGTISASVSNADADANSTTVSCTVGQVTIQDGTDASQGGGNQGNQGGNNGADWTLPSSSNAVATSAQTKWTARYITTDAAQTSKADAITGTPGWYATKAVDGITKYYRITGGYVIGSTYYASSVDLPASYSTIIVFGTSVNVPAKGTSLTVDVYPNGTGATSLSISGSGLTNLTVTDSKYRTEFRDRVQGGKVDVTLSNTWATNKSVTLKMTDVDCTSINLDGPYTHTVTLENVNVGGITLDGTGTINSKATSAKQTLNVNTTTSAIARANTLGAVNVTGNTSAVNITDATATSVSLTGANTSLTVDGANSSVGDITINEGGLITSTTTALTKISVQNATVGDISFTGNNTLTGNATISVTGTAGNINMSSVKAKPVITVPGGTTGAISVAAGTVTVSGSYAKLGAVTLDGSASFTMTGTNHTVTSIAANNSNVKISVPAEPSNTLAMVNATDLDLYKGHGIQGGTWVGNPVPAAALNTSLVYELNVVNADTYTYYNASQLNQALVSQFKNATANDPTDGTGDNAILCAVGQSGTISGGTKGTNYYEMVFKNGKTLWGTMLVTGEMRITLPTLINTVTVTKWADKFRSNWPAGGAYSTPKVADAANGEWELNASGGITNGDITKITDVSVKSSWLNNSNNDAMGDVKATLSGNVISLSGAVPAGTSSMTLYLTTDAVEQAKDNQGNALDEDVPVTLAVGLTYFSGDKSLNFSNVANDQLTHGATLEFDTNTSGVLRLSNGTKYTLNGSGLKERADNITVVDSSDNPDTKDWFNNNFIEVSVNVSTLKTQAAKDEVIALLNGTGALYDWTDSPAVREAVNAALATITDSQVATWIKTAKTNAWKKVNSGTPTESDLNETGYDDAFLVPYLQVNVTAYNPNGTLTATLVPSWRVEVRQTGAGTNNRYSTAFADAKNPNLPGNVYVAKAGAAMTLGTNVSEIEKFDNLTSGVVVKLSSDSAQLFSTLGNIYMHQDSTYAYKMDAQGSGTGYLIRHAGSGSGLGTVTINTTEPLITLYSSKQSNIPIAYFDTLQAAVNDAQDQQHIDVDQNYKGSMSVNVTGYARTFTIQANGQNVVVANASGGMVSLNNTGSEYTVQLNRDNTAVVDGSTATIAVAQVANGSAGVSVTTAKAGATVTVTCTPAAGYRTNAVTVSAHMTQNNTNVAVTVTKVSDNVYTFKVPEGADTITVTPAFVVGTAAAAIPFTDVATNHWAYNSVKYVYDNGLMNGVNTAGTQFGGNQSLTRAMVVTILYRAAGSPYVGTTSSFSDVASNTWYSQAVAWASQNNIVTGYLNGTFQPTWDITRQELATILYRYNTSYKGRATTGSTTLTGFPDQGNVSDWATASMQWAVGNGIVNGITNGTTTTLSPAGNATRYEAATMLMRYGQGLGL